MNPIANCANYAYPIDKISHLCYNVIIIIVTHYVRRTPNIRNYVSKRVFISLKWTS